MINIRRIVVQHPFMTTHLGLVAPMRSARADHDSQGYESGSLLIIRDEENRSLQPDQAR